MFKIHLLLNEVEKQQLNEIGEISSKMFPWSKGFYKINKDSYFTIFLAPPLEDLKTNFNYNKIPEIWVTFEFLNPGSYSVGYIVNNTDTQAFKTSAAYYFKVLSTVIYIILDFMKEEKPKTLYIKGTDKTDVKIPGQKDRIYFSYVEKNAEKVGYVYGHEKGSLVLTRKD